MLYAYRREARTCNDGTAARGVVVVADDHLARRSGDYERFVDALTHQEGRVYADARGRKDLYSEDVEGMGLIGVAFAKIETRKIKRRSSAPGNGSSSRSSGWQSMRS